MSDIVKFLFVALIAIPIIGLLAPKSNQPIKKEKPVIILTQEQTKVCNDYAALARRIMFSRQRGVSKQDLYYSVSGNPFAEEIVSQAFFFSQYDQPSVIDYNVQKHGERWFEKCKERFGEK
ncbi:hypothetical protein RCJ22_16995 [Vibrio sp. FNV 38]|nr:hypothetical protein [Vibrio sp. FNV 38]